MKTDSRANRRQVTRTMWASSSGLVLASASGLEHRVAMDRSNVSESMWKVFEPYHAVTYFSPLALEEIAAAGLRGFWRGYFATRAAPLGRSPAEVVAAVFFSFHPSMVARAIPEVWTLVTPADAWQARLAGVDRALRDVLAEATAGERIRRAARIARCAAELCPTEGRALFASHLSLEWPTAPHLALWHAATLLREHRGDGHVAALTVAGIGGCEALVMANAAGTVDRGQTQPNRGWSDTEWQSATDVLADRGLLLHDGQLSPDGRTLWQELAAETNSAAAAPWRRVDDGEVEELFQTLRTLAHTLYDTSVIPWPNPIGVTKPSAE